MAKSFNQFEEKNNPSAADFIVGYDVETQEEIKIKISDLTAVGADGESVQIQYGSDQENWHFPYQVGDVFMRQRLGTAAWSGAIKMALSDYDRQQMSEDIQRNVDVEIKDVTERVSEVEISLDVIREKLSTAIKAAFLDNISNLDSYKTAACYCINPNRNGISIASYLVKETQIVLSVQGVNAPESLFSLVQEATFIIDGKLIKVVRYYNSKNDVFSAWYDVFSVPV
jgi:hypothetical protein